MNIDNLVNHFKRILTFKHDGTGFESVSTVNLVLLILASLVLSPAATILLAVVLGGLYHFHEDSRPSFNLSGDFKSVLVTLLLVCLPFGAAAIFLTGTPPTVRLAILGYLFAMWGFILYAAWKRLYAK